MAAGETTYLHFDAPLDRASVEVEARATRFRWVDVGDTLIGLEPSVDLGSEEKLVVRARYKDGASPASLTLVLVTRPGLVDKEVSVVRRAHTREALEAKVAELESSYGTLKTRCEEGALPNLGFSGLLGRSIQITTFSAEANPSYHGGLEPGSGTGYRAERWAMVVLRLHNLPGHAPWKPGSARLTSVDGTRVQVSSVHLEKPQLEPGEFALVVVMLEPPTTKESLFRLELVDASGGLHPIHNIRL